VYGTAFTLTALGLYASLSRSAMVNVLIVGVALVVVPYDIRKGGRRMIAVTGVLLVAATLAPGAVQMVRESEDDVVKASLGRFVATLDAAMEGAESLDAAGGNRLTSWSRALHLWTDHPLLGVGYKALVPLYRMLADNSVIVILVETGAVGLALFLVFIAAVFRSSVRAYTGGRPGGREVLILFAGQTLHGLTADTLTFPGSMTIVVICFVAWHQLVRYNWPEGVKVYTLEAYAELQSRRAV
jgi:O-antigen ligase